MLVSRGGNSVVTTSALSALSTGVSAFYASYTGSKGRMEDNGMTRRPFIIGVAGGTASGKSTVCQKIVDAVLNQDKKGRKELEMMSKEKGQQRIVCLSQDAFYKDLSEEQAEMAKKGHFNFDHPDAFDMELMVECLEDIRCGRRTSLPVYDFVTNSRLKGQEEALWPADVVLVEGILIFYFPELRAMLDLKLFVDTDADTRLARRVRRDISERKRDLQHVLTQYTTLVKPAFEEFCLPTKKFADVIVPRGAENTVAIALVAQHIIDVANRIQRENSKDQDEDEYLKSSSKRSSGELCSSGYDSSPNLSSRSRSSSESIGR